MSNINKEELMRGLSDSQVNKSKQDFGTNALAKKETESLRSRRQNMSSHPLF